MNPADSQALAHKSMRDRHWKQVMATTGALSQYWSC